SLVSIPAGLAKMNLVRFSLLTAAGSGIWNALWISIGVQLGDRWREAEGWAKYLDYAVYAIALLVVAALLLKLIKRRGTSAS
ncbi:MAG: DedA family protein, partial [Candidatus Nanopelagicaceae bacterium]